MTTCLYQSKASRDSATGAVDDVEDVTSATGKGSRVVKGKGKGSSTGKGSSMGVCLLWYYGCMSINECCKKQVV